MINVTGLIERLESGCNRHVHGRCHLRACFIRGGYTGDLPFDPDKATCEAREEAQAIRTLVEDNERLTALCRANNDLARMTSDHRDEWRSRATELANALEAVTNGDVDVSDTAIIVGNGASAFMRALRDTLSKVSTLSSLNEGEGL